MRPQPPARNYFDSDPSVALANATQAKDINSLNAWLTAQQQLAGLNNRVQTQRLDRQQGLQKEDILNNLAANGLGRSGDVGYLQGQSALDFNDRRYDQNASTLSNLAGLMSDYLSKKSGIRDNTTNAYQSAFETQAQNPVPGTGSAPPQPRRTAPVGARKRSPYYFGGGTAKTGVPAAPALPKFNGGGTY